MQETQIPGCLAFRWFTKVPEIKTPGCLAPFLDLNDYEWHERCALGIDVVELDNASVERLQLWSAEVALAVQDYNVVEGLFKVAIIHFRGDYTTVVESMTKPP